MDSFHVLMVFCFNRQRAVGEWVLTHMRTMTAYSQCQTWYKNTLGLSSHEEVKIRNKYTLKQSDNKSMVRILPWYLDRG